MGEPSYSNRQGRGLSSDGSKMMLFTIGHGTADVTTFVALSGFPSMGSPMFRRPNSAGGIRVAPGGGLIYDVPSG
jgi:hypothetical protein